MFSIIKFCFFFVISFMILSFPVKDKELFYHMHEASKHVTQPLFEGTKTSAESVFKRVKALSKQAFNNIIPKDQQTLKRKTKAQDQIEAMKHKYTDEEKSLLQDVLANQ